METLYTSASAVVGLQRLYARLKGELKRIDRDGKKLLLETERKLTALDKLRAARTKHMENVGATLELLQPGIALIRIRPIVTTRRMAALPHGRLRSGILAVLKAYGGWLTVAEIHDVLIARFDVVFLDRHEKDKHRKHLNEALHVLANFDPPRIEREHKLPPGDFVTKQRWRLAAVFRE